MSGDDVTRPQATLAKLVEAGFSEFTLSDDVSHYYSLRDMRIKAIK